MTYRLSGVSHPGFVLRNLDGEITPDLFKKLSRDFYYAVHKAFGPLIEYDMVAVDANDKQIASSKYPMRAGENEDARLSFEAANKNLTKEIWDSAHKVFVYAHTKDESCILAFNADEYSDQLLFQANKSKPEWLESHREFLANSANLVERIGDFVAEENPNFLIQDRLTPS